MFHFIPVVQTGTPKVVIGGFKPQGFHQVQLGLRIRTKTCNVTGVLWDLGFDEDNLHVGILSEQTGGFKDL